MRILHIGKDENIEKHPPHKGYPVEFSCTSLPMGLEVEAYCEAEPRAQVLIVDAIAPITAELIGAFPQLKLIHSEGVATNAIDVAAAAAAGVYVCNCAGMNAGAVAEQAVLLMSGMLRDVVHGDAAVRAGRQIDVKQGYMARGDLLELADCTVGLVGAGNIARACARLLAAYGAPCVYWSRHRLSAELERELCLTWTPSLDELLKQSDIVSLHVPVSPETTHMANDSFFAAMREESYFVNTARGELVDDAALARALASDKLRAAGLDTLDNEPVSQDHPLLNLPDGLSERILLSPHIGGITASSFTRGYAIIWDNIARLAAGERPRNLVA